MLLNVFKCRKAPELIVKLIVLPLLYELTFILLVFMKMLSSTYHIAVFIVTITLKLNHFTQ